MPRMKRLAVLGAVIALFASMAVPAHGWTNGGCSFSGSNWLSSGRAYAKTWSTSANCFETEATAKYKVDGAWYIASPAYGYEWVIASSPRDYPSDSGGRHRGRYGPNWGSYQYSY